MTFTNLFPLGIDTARQSITCNGQVLKTRSRALLVLVCVLVRQKRAQPDAPWLGIEALRGVLPSVHGKQLQRFVDALAAIAFPIGYESKTRGRYWLTAAAETVMLDVDDAGLAAFINARGDLNPQSLQSANLTAPPRPEQSRRSRS